MGQISSSKCVTEDISSLPSREMATPSDQQFLNDLDDKLWTAADRLRANLDAAVYKHVVLGLVFLKYVSDAFDLRQEELRAQFDEPQHANYLDPAGFADDAEREENVRIELEERDYYTEENVFWVPGLARWKTIRENARVANGTKIEVRNGKASTYAFTTLARLIDDALEAIERENPKLKGVLEKIFTRYQLDPANLASLVDLMSTIPFRHASLHAKDILGHVYEYFLGEFALAEGKKGGQYFTPKSIVSLIVEMLEPYSGRVYDPAMGSGGFFVQSEKFVEEHGGRRGQLSVYGQESNPTTWRLAAMNMAIRGIDFNFGREPANSFTNDQHPDLRADFVMANPPFNISEWWEKSLEGDVRWKEFGTPPASNANFAWVLHMLHHLAPTGSMALLLANGSMSSNQSGEGEIRRKLIEADLVECMLALPGQLFTNTQIPACVWFLTKNKRARTLLSSDGEETFYRNRRGETLFIDARNLGYLKDRVLRDFKAEDIEKITTALRKWRYDDLACRESVEAGGGTLPALPGSNYQDIPGFCASVKTADITKHGYVLTPGRYVGAEEVADDGDPFEEKMPRLVAELHAQFAKSTKLEQSIKANLRGLGYGG